MKDHLEKQPLLQFVLEISKPKTLRKTDLIDLLSSLLLKGIIETHESLTKISRNKQCPTTL